MSDDNYHQKLRDIIVSSRWRNIWLFCLLMAVLQLRLGMADIAKAIREARDDYSQTNR